MNFEELQKEWQAVKSEPRSHSDLRTMMYASPDTRIRQIKGKEILKFCGSAMLIGVLTYAFDLLKNWSSAVFVAWSVFLLFDEYLGLRYMSFLPQKDTLQKTLMELLSRMDNVKLWSRIAHASVWIITVLILNIRMQLELADTALLALLLFPLLMAMSWWSTRKWARKIAEVKMILKELNEELVAA